MTSSLTPSRPPVPAATSTEIRAVGVSKSFGDHTVLDHVDLLAAPGHRLGVIGENGAGKSTLLAIITGSLEPDLGSVARPPGTAHLHQEFPFTGDTTVSAVLAAAMATAREIEAELDAAASALGDVDDRDAAARYARALEAAERADVWNADRRATMVIDGLGLGHLADERTIDSLSGGERTRLELATILVANPPALVLDEPTNHLDDDAIDFLTSHLQSCTGPVVMASHDRLFLEQVCTGILDLDPGRTASRYSGGTFEHYLRHRERERARWAQQYAAEQDELSSLRYSLEHTAPNVSHFRAPSDNDKMQYNYKGSRVNHQIARRIRNTRERLDTLESEQVPRPPDALHFAAPAPLGLDDHEAVLGAVGIGLSGRLRPTDVTVDGATRLLVTGRNGAGKSTLLAILAAVLQPDVGICSRRRGLRIGYLPQDVTFDDDELTPSQLFGRHARGSTLHDLGLLNGRDLARPVGVLSVGQRRRVALGCLVATRPHVLLMDEPTNHLSLALAEELEDALMTSLGAVVVASHDRWLRRRWDGDEMRLEPAR